MRKLVEMVGYPRNTVWRALLQLKDERFVTTTPTGRYLVHPRFRFSHEGYKETATWRWSTRLFNGSTAI